MAEPVRIVLALAEEEVDLRSWGRRLARAIVKLECPALVPGSLAQDDEEVA